MNTYEILILNGELLKRMQRIGITEDDVQNMQLFEDYRAMKDAGEKTFFIVRTLCDKYGKAERTIYRLIKRYNELCQPATLE